MIDINSAQIKIRSFFMKDIWNLRLEDLSPVKSFFIRTLRVIYLTVAGFDKNNCFLRASALTFFTLVSIVPLAALFFGIAKGFGLEKLLEEYIMEQFAAHESVVINVIAFADSLLKNTRGGVLAGAGIIVLFWAAIKILSHIEISLNAIWGIRQSRSFARKFSDYLSVLILCPILLILSSSLNVFLTTQITEFMEKAYFLHFVGPVFLTIMKLFPTIIFWILFTFMYKFIPNTKVDLISALTAGLIAGILYQLVQIAFITFQVGASKYNAIYGSFAALPLFLTWLQLSWIILLFGAELSFAQQNVRTYEFESEAVHLSTKVKKLIALQISYLLVSRFHNGDKPVTAHYISENLALPLRLVRQICGELSDSGIVSETLTDQDKESAYQPARDIHQLTLQCILDALEERGSHDIHPLKEEVFDSIAILYEKMRDAAAKSPGNRLLLDI
ncbi:MAG: YihY/virulence factor BrkB family protein [Syntrophales bacterium]|nr:YihY/virulence factor BrkB family protein [Syntrophales bacterium]MDY0043854.1 YihY/virulence factor BrkB family protein [Syntrophales bacterium]